MSDNITTIDYKILKYVKNHPCSPSELPNLLSKTVAYRFNNLLNLGYFEPASCVKDELGALKPSGIYKLSPKGLTYLENCWSIKIDDIKTFLRREILTIITAFITAAVTTYILPVLFNLCKLLLEQ